MSLPARLVVQMTAAAGDGGTIWIEAIDERNVKHDIVLNQAAHVPKLRSLDPKRIPGRLYFNGEIIPIRSKQETELLALLRGAEVRFVSRQGVREPEYDDGVREDVNYVVERVESPRYLSFAAEVSDATQPPNTQQ